MKNIRAESLAIEACKRGDLAALEQLLKPLKNPPFEVLLLLTIQKVKPTKITLHDRLGFMVDARLRTRPGEKREICHELAEQYGKEETGLTPDQVRHYHEQFLKKTKPMRPLLDRIREIDAEQRR